MCKDHGFNPGTGVGFYLQTVTCCNCSIFYVLYIQYLLPHSKSRAAHYLFSMVNKRLCSPAMKYFLKVYSVVLCMLGRSSFCLQTKFVTLTNDVAELTPTKCRYSANVGRNCVRYAQTRLRCHTDAKFMIYL